MKTGVSDGSLSLPPPVFTQLFYKKKECPLGTLKKKLLYKMTEKVRFSSEGTKSVKTTIRQSDGYRYSSLDRTYKSGKGSLTVKATTADKTVIRIKESRKANGSLIRKNLETDPKGITELTITEKDSIGKKTVAVYRFVGKGKVSLTKLTTNKETVTIPSKVSYNKKEGYKVVSIAKKALKGNKTIKNLTIGKNVVRIGGSAFAGLNSVEEVIFRSGNKVKISKGAFSGTGTKTRFFIYADEPEYTYIVNRIKKAGADSEAIFEMKTAESKKKSK